MSKCKCQDPCCIPMCGAGQMCQVNSALQLTPVQNYGAGTMPIMMNCPDHNYDHGNHGMGSSWICILILLCLVCGNGFGGRCGNNNGCGCGDVDDCGCGNNNGTGSNWIWIIILLFCCCGNGFGGIGGNNGCGCGC